MGVLRKIFKNIIDKLKDFFSFNDKSTIENQEEFPDFSKARLITEYNFRRLIIEQKPEKIYACGGSIDDFGYYQSFLIFYNGEMVKTNSYAPITDDRGFIRNDVGTVAGILDNINLPYREINIKAGEGYYIGEYRFGKFPLNFDDHLCVYILEEK